ncbi:MAG: DUF3943 domain-containing protein [Deltaproteobacteria bacterium]
MRIINRFFCIVLFFILSAQASAQEDFRTEDLFNNYTLAENTDYEEMENAGENNGFTYDDPQQYRLGTKEFVRDTAISYAFVWAARFFYVRNKNSRIFDTSLSKWWDNITQWPEFDDGDSFFTNWVTHPIIGSIQYLYYRQMGHGFWGSALGALVQNVLFEYTIEGLVETPSLADLISTTAVGVPIGVALEESSDWLISTGFVPAKILGHILNPMRNFIHDRQIGVYNPFSKTFMSVSGPLEFTPGKKEAVDLAYPLFLEEPLPLGRFRADLEVVNLKKDLGGQFIFYSVRIDVPSSSGLWGVYVQIAQSGTNEVVVNGDNIKDGYEFSNLVVGGKFLLYEASNAALSGGMGVTLPTAFKDNIDRLQTVLLFKRNFPVNLKGAWTLTPYITGAAWKGIFSFQGMVATDWVLNASNLEGNDFEFRLDYGAAVGANFPVVASPVLFAEFNGYSLLTADTSEKTDLFASSGIRFGRKYSPGFVVQFPLSGPDKDVDRFSYLFDFQVRF